MSKDKLSALMVWGGWPGHEPKQCADIFAPWLEKKGFEVAVSDTLDTSFDVHAHTTPHIEIYGTQGTLQVPDPNTFGGPVKIKRAGAQEWSEIPPTHVHTENSRGIAVADMAYALRTGRPHRATGEMAYHVLDIMPAVHDASAAGAHVSIESTCRRPAPLPTGLLPGRLGG